MGKEYLPQVTSDRIKALASSNGISLSQLNEICGLSKNAIAQAGKGTEGMKAKNLYAIAEVLNCSVDYLLGRAIEENNNIPSIRINDDSIADNSTNKKNGIIIENFTGNEFISNFIEQFSSLSYSEQLEIMNLVNKKAKAE